MTSQPSTNDIVTTNPYESHPSLTPLESAVLWEYAKLAHNVRMVCIFIHHPKLIHDHHHNPVCLAVKKHHSFVRPLSVPLFRSVLLPHVARSSGDGERPFARKRLLEMMLNVDMVMDIERHNLTILFSHQLTQKTRAISEEPDKVMLAKLRILEKKMGLVLTLFKASVWGVINEQPETSMHSGGHSEGNDTTIRH
ncbi:hypothetical protein D9613_003132 [Agrocybe pediades]|uniref:DASH complex subunit DAD3 n=1 Tax=Agrocybe pediades TaxID=84607 RepID=A0A8H4VM83_9AGAR|nr:hypothetical protein D9613_003132 [Agrocybe pediades]